MSFRLTFAAILACTAGLAAGPTRAGNADSARVTAFADVLRGAGCNVVGTGPLSEAGFEAAEADALIAWLAQRGLGSKSAAGAYALAPALCGDEDAPPEARMTAALTLNGCHMHEDEAPILLPKLGFDKTLSQDTVGAMLDKGLVTLSEDRSTLVLVGCGE
jgi:hypothetical protein